MSGKRGLFAGVAAILLAGSGCTTCGSKGFGLAHEAGPSCEIPTSQRNQVYVFAIGGMNPLGVIALSHLREELNKQGYAKVASGQTIHESAMASQMREIKKDNPEALFVILGSEAGAPVAERLAHAALADGLPIAAFVLIDADAKTQVPDLGVRVLAVGGYGSTSSSVEAISVPDVRRFALPADPRTVSAVARLLNEIAMGVPQPITEEVTSWSYQHAAPLRPEVDPGRDMEWDYLFDQPGGVTRAIGAGTPVIAAKPATPGNAAAQR